MEMLKSFSYVNHLFVDTFFVCIHSMTCHNVDAVPSIIYGRWATIFGDLKITSFKLVSPLAKQF